MRLGVIKIRTTDVAACSCYPRIRNSLRGCMRIRLRSRNQENNGWKGPDRDQRIREENGEFERNNSERAERISTNSYGCISNCDSLPIRGERVFIISCGREERERETIEGGSEAEGEKSIWKRGGGVNETSINIKINLDCHFVGRAAPDAAT